MDAHVWTIGEGHYVIPGAERLVVAGDIVSIVSEAKSGSPGGRLLAVVKLSDKIFVTLGSGQPTRRVPREKAAPEADPPHPRPRKAARR
jgi:hypothetical protein